MLVITVVQRNDTQLAMGGNTKIYKITLDMNFKGVQKVQKEQYWLYGIKRIFNPDDYIYLGWQQGL